MVLINVEEFDCLSVIEEDVYWAGLCSLVDKLCNSNTASKFTQTYVGIFVLQIYNLLANILVYTNASVIR